MLVHFWWWIQYHIGMTNGSGRPYLFWSGFGSDFGELTIVGGLIAIYRQHECHVDGCHRRGKYPFQHYRLCSRHHPNVPQKLTHLAIIKLHKAKE